MATSRHWVRQQVAVAAGGKDRHRQPDAETPWSLAIAEADARTSRPRADGSAIAPNPGTSWEASSEMKEDKRDRRAGGELRPNARRKQREGDAARTRTAWRDAIPAERLPEHASAASKEVSTGTN
jgi:hypothetical protein